MVTINSFAIYRLSISGENCDETKGKIFPCVLLKWIQWKVRNSVWIHSASVGFLLQFKSWLGWGEGYKFPNLWQVLPIDQRIPFKIKATSGEAPRKR